MRCKYGIILAIFLVVSLYVYVPRAAATDWDPVTDAEKNMKSNPLDPGAGAVVLFKRGQVEILEKQSLNWATRIQTYTRIKILNDAGRQAANVAVDTQKYTRLSKIEGRTILPSGEIIPLDASKVFRGKVYQSGKNFAVLQTSFTFPSVEPGAIIEYQIEEYEDWFFPDPWVFDTRELGTLQSSLRVLIGPRLAMSVFPLDTAVNKITMARNETVQGTQLDFSTSNLHPVQTEPFSPPYYDLATMVLFAPRRISFNQTLIPVIENWNDVADQVSESSKKVANDKEAGAKAKELALKAPDVRSKAEAIYKYIQQNVTSSNMVGVRLYRGADDLLKAKHGDPDEINALFVSMLQDAKVDADMVLVATQNWQTLVRGFPNYSQFSRIITRVNLKQGAVFADPSDPGAPFGEVPWFERGVLGLAVKGSKMQEAMIPAGSAEDNVSTEKATVQVSKDWTCEGDSEIALKGAEAIDFRDDLLDEAPAKLDQRLTDYFAYGRSDAEVSAIVHPDFKDSSQPFVLKAHLREKLTNEAEGGLLLNPWLDDQYERPLFKATVRHSAVRFNNPERRTSTSTWQLAPEIKVEQLPKEAKIENDLGGFSHSCAQSGNTVTCTRTYYLKKTLLQSTLEYMNARKFFDEIAKDDQEVIVLREQ